MDAQLPEELRDTFVHQDLYPALELVSTDSEQLPASSKDLDRYRTLVARGNAVYAFRLNVELDIDGGVSVTSISVDLVGPDPGGAR